MKKIVLIIFTSIISVSLIAQDDRKEQQLFQQAKTLQNEKKWDEAFVILKNLLKSDSSNVEYLWRTSFIYSKLGINQNTESQKQEWFGIAAYLGKRAITQHPQNANAHYAYAVSLGRMTELVGNQTKIEYSKLIKSEAETAIKLNPKLAGAYHILGRWHREIANFNIFERAMIKALFGGMPGGTYEESIKNFERAILLEPMNGLHYYELAQSYLARDESEDKKNAKNWLLKATLITIRSEDDATNKSLCEELLKEI